MLLLLLLFCQYKADFLQLSKSSPKKHWAPWRGAISTLTFMNTLPLICFGSEVRVSRALGERVSIKLKSTRYEVESRKHWGAPALSSPRHCLALAVSTLATWQAYWVLFLSRWLWPQSLARSGSCLFLCGQCWVLAGWTLTLTEELVLSKGYCSYFSFEDNRGRHLASEDRQGVILKHI